MHSSQDISLDIMMLTFSVVITTCLLCINDVIKGHHVVCWDDMHGYGLMKAGENGFIKHTSRLKWQFYDRNVTSDLDPVVN